MRFLFDESVEARVAGYLREFGHDVFTIGLDHPPSIADTEVIRIAYLEQRILVTNDTDFGELIFLHRIPHAGVILLRLGQLDVQHKASWLVFVVTQYTGELNQFIVVTPHGVRIRRSV